MEIFFPLDGAILFAEKSAEALLDPSYERFQKTSSRYLSLGVSEQRSDCTHPSSPS
jgi:hypothetical protein